VSCRIFTTGNFKGGVGKSTTAVCVAEELAHRGRKVLIANADPQGTAMQWIKAAPANDPMRVEVVDLAQAKGNLHRMLEPLVCNYDAIVIDCPPSMDAEAMQSALLVSDLCVMPMQPTPADYWATQGMLELITAVRGVNPTLAAVALANRVSNSRICRQVLEVMRDSGIPLLGTQLRTRVSFQEAAVRGTVPARMGSAHKKAAMEIKNITNELLQRMGWE